MNKPFHPNPPSSRACNPYRLGAKHRLLWSRRRLGLVFLASLGVLTTLLPSRLVAQGEDNPTGVSGVYNGNVTTAGNYDPLTGNAMRIVDDIVVRGSVGAYPLKWTRYANSRNIGPHSNDGDGTWTFAYDYHVDPLYATWIRFPDGRFMNFSGDCPPSGVEESIGTWTAPDGPHFGILLADGGKVAFNSYTITVVYPDSNGNLQTTYAFQSDPIYVIDPYGQITTISYDTVYDTQYPQMRYRRSRITEPGGRYLQINYTSADPSAPVSGVQAFDGRGNMTQSVSYTWSNWTPPGGSTVYTVLTGVAYSDGTQATYTYTEVYYGSQLGKGPALATADDVHYAGAMRQIAYQYFYDSTSGHYFNAIQSENHLVSGQAGEMVSSLGGGVGNTDTKVATETRGDGATRSFTYGGKVNHNCVGTTGKLLNYTDFLGHTTILSYDSSGQYVNPSYGFINAVTDSNGHTTTYARQANSWGIKTITHPDGSTIGQTFWPSNSDTQPYYLASRTDERGNTTTYTRDANNRITRKDYADASYETFDYSCNNFGQVCTHRMRNGAYQHFAYTARGLLTDKWNPTWNSTPLGSDPKTHYDYYPSGPWTDRVYQETDPRGLITQYDYDRAYDANGENSGASTSQAPVAGRGLVTRITHISDSSNYQSFGYDNYGNKLWEANELQQRTTCIYDDYKRLLTVKNPLGKILTNKYTPTNGTSTSPYVHTTSSIYTTTTPTGIVTKNIWDANFRKASTTEGYGTSLAATTTFGYDAVGNPTSVTDPLNHTTNTAYDGRNRKITETDALNQSTQWFYDAASNILHIVRKDGTTEDKTYDQMNRVLTDTVPQTGTVNVTTTFDYYLGTAVKYGGLLYHVTDAKLQVTTFSDYKPSGLKARVTYPNGDLHGFDYDADLNLTVRQTVNGTTQNFTYDNRNRKATMAWTNPLNVSNFTAEWANFGYDPASRLTSAQNGIGAVGAGIISTITRQYDAAGRLTLDRQNLSATLGNKDVQYEYDDDGKDKHLYLTSASYDYTFTYDAMGRFEKIFATGASNPPFQYYYDAASNEVERYNYLNSVGQFYTRDALDRMSRRDVKLNTSVISSEAYGYDAMSRMLTVDREDGKRDQFTYYLDGELWTAQYAQPTPTPTATPSATPTPPPNQCAPVTFSTTGGGSTTLKVYMSTATTGATIFYTVGNTDYVTPTHNGSAATGNTRVYTGPVSVAIGTEKFFEAVAYKSGMTDSVFTEFDADNTGGGGNLLLMSPSGSGRSVTYNIDQMGNRTSVIDTGVTTTYTQTAGLNQYSQVGTNGVSNDNEHELLSYQNISYTYINDERLSSVTGNGSSYQLAYDALGRCVKRTLNGTVTYYIYDGEKPIVEYSSAGSVIGRNLYGKSIDETLMRIDASFGTYYYQDDHEGSVTHLLSSAGAILERYRYDVFGAPSIEDANGNTLTASAKNNRFMFTGREYRWQFGIYEYRARAYHPGLGRFTGEDPKGFDAGDYNLFRYCHNDPEDLTDPMGLFGDQTADIAKLKNAQKDQNSMDATPVAEAVVVSASAIDPQPSASELSKGAAFIQSQRSAFDNIHVELGVARPQEDHGFTAAQTPTTPHIYTKEEISEIEPGDFSDTDPPFNPLDFFSFGVAKMFSSAGRAVATSAGINAGSHALRHMPEALRSPTAEAIARDIAQRGAPAAGRDVQRTISAGGREISYRARGLPDGTTKVSSVVEGSFSRDISAPSSR